jgi:hypothetical protein
MLQQIHLVTAPVAKAIIDRYPTVKSLYEAYGSCSTREQAENLLADITVSWLLLFLLTMEI